jgi:PKD repeat protein
MKNFILFFLMLFSMSLIAQSTHTIDFEPGGTGSEWEWIVDQNATNPPLEFIPNPVSGGINTSASVAKFTAKQAGMPWALTFTDDDGLFTFDASNAIVKIMIYKPNISNVALKFEGMSPAVEIQIPNTLINQWEEMTFDFTAHVGKTYSRIVIIPDFTTRPNDRIIYFDNIQVPDGEVQGPLPEPTTVPPPSPHQDEDVISIYSEDHPNVPNTNYNPNWGQSTIVTVDYLAAGNKTLRYESLNYQGTEYSNQDVSLYENLHVDFWTPNSTNLSIFLISPGAETFYELPVSLEEWVSVDIPLSHFVPPVNLANVFQFKVVGNGTVYFDNLYFWKNPTASGEDATLSDLQVDEETIPGFAPGTLNYEYELPFGTIEVPEVSATATNQNATVVIIPAVSLPGTTEVVVTSEDSTNTLTYNVNFTVMSPEPSTVPPLPPHAAEDVISIYSDAYTNVDGTNFNPFWGQQTVVTLDYVVAGNNTLRYQNLNFQGTELVNLDVSEYDYFHLDFWTSNATSLTFYLISPGPQEKGFTLDINPETWESVDIPLSYFVPPVNLSDIFQFKVEGNGDVWFDNWYFWQDNTISGTVTFNPANGEIEVPVDIDPTISFSAPVEKADGSPVTNSDIPTIITFKKDNATGQNVPFSGVISEDKQLITINPTANLQSNQVYYLSLNDEVLRFQQGNPIQQQSVNFTTVFIPKPYLTLNIQDNFENDGSSTIDTWMFQDVGFEELEITTDPVNTENNVADYNRTGGFPYTNAQVILEHRMNLQNRRRFEMRVYFPSSNNYGGSLDSTAAIKLQNSLLGANAYTTETKIEHTITQLDEWVTLVFNFSTAADSVNYDQIVVQLGGEGHNEPGQFYFDDFRLLQATSGIEADFSANPTTGFSPLTVQFSDLSTGATPTSWQWDFENDGTIDATVKNPLHTYETPGVYSVYMRAANPFFNGTITKINYITVLEPVEPEYIYTDFDDNVNVELSGWPNMPEAMTNPDMGGINPSPTAGQWQRSGELYANIFTTLDASINFDNSDMFLMKAFSPKACQVLFKLENSQNPAINTQRFAQITATDQWQQLVFDFSGEASDLYDKIIIFMDFESNDDNTFYFDDLSGPPPTGLVLYKPLLALDVQDNFENDGHATINQWNFQDPDLLPLTIVEDPENAENHVAEYNRSGVFEWTNAQFILDHRMDLSERNRFEMKAYFPSSNDYSGLLLPKVEIKLQNSLLGDLAYTTQSVASNIVSDFDQWLTLEFDFGFASAIQDYDQVVVQFGGEGHFVPGIFWFDDLKLLQAEEPLQQIVQLNYGWSAISSYVIPDDPTITGLFDGIWNDDDFVIMVGDGGVFYPSQELYTITNWNSQSGYLIKMYDDREVIFQGAASPQEITIQEGWSLIPVLSSCEVNTEALLSQYPMVTMVKEVAGIGIYWPEMGINTLETLSPGKAYYVHTTGETTINFPQCQENYKLKWSDDFN